MGRYFVPHLHAISSCLVFSLFCSLPVLDITPGIPCLIQLGSGESLAIYGSGSGLVCLPGLPGHDSRPACCRRTDW